MTRFIVLGVAVLVMAVTSATVSATEQDRARELSTAGTIVPLERITAQMRARRIDHILEVELESSDAGHYYEIEGLDDQGKVRKLKYNAQTGKLISDEEDD